MNKNTSLELPASHEVWVVEGESADLSTVWALYANPRQALAAARRFKRRHPGLTFRTANWLIGGCAKTDTVQKVAYVITNNAPPDACCRGLMSTLKKAIIQKHKLAEFSKAYTLRIERWEIQGEAEVIDRAKWT